MNTADIAAIWFTGVFNGSREAILRRKFAKSSDVKEYGTSYVVRLKKRQNRSPSAIKRGGDVEAGDIQFLPETGLFMATVVS